MIDPETRALIRRYFYAEHWKVGTIAHELGVHPDAVRNAIETQRLGSAYPVRASMSMLTWPSSRRLWLSIPVCAPRAFI